MALWGTVVAAECLGTVWALADDLERGRGALRRVGRHFGLGVGGGGGAGLVGLGDGGDVVHDPVLASLLGSPRISADYGGGGSDAWMQIGAGSGDENRQEKGTGGW